MINKISKVVYMALLTILIILSLIANIIGEDLSNATIVSTLCLCTMAIIATRPDDNENRADRR